jgi:hypothetical protein
MMTAKRFTRRRVVQLYDVTSAVAGALDTGVLDTESFDALLVSLNVAAGAVSGLAAIKAVREDNSQQIIKSASGLAAGAEYWGFSIGEDVNTSADTSAALRNNVPVPRRTRIDVVGAAGCTVRLTVAGVVKR